MSREYSNPIAKKGDFADPFVLRYHGKYYLYATNPDLRCFSSDDLIHWKPEGPVITPEVFDGLVPFAPEVVRYAGAFYMYTSPSGLGHYLLKSDSPTGPFQKISENLGHTIDGHVFIDDDGKWYFYWAGEEGIWGCEMASPTEFGEPVLTGAALHGWTEGPLIHKRDGIYYMTYTGNHYLSSGYRIQAAWSKDPLRGFCDDLYNPVAVHTEGKGVGLGHSSTVVGPDLVSYYLVYHNLNHDATRDLNVDRILWHREATQILGPTRTAQPAPALPDASCPAVSGGRELKWQMKRGSWAKRGELSYAQSGGFEVQSLVCLSRNFTCEGHLLIPAGNEQCGMKLQCQGQSSLFVMFSNDGRYIQLIQKEGKRQQILAWASLGGEQLYDILQQITIQLYNRRLSVRFNNRALLACQITAVPVGIGYFSEASAIGVGYTAVTNAAYESACQNVRIPANCSFMPSCGGGTFRTDEKGRVLLGVGERAEYQIRAAAGNSYFLYITIKDPDRSQIRVLLNEKAVGGDVCDRGVIKVRVDLAAGEQRLVLEGVTGETTLERIELTEQPVRKPQATPGADTVGPYGKRVFAGTEGDDYNLVADFIIKQFGENGSAGILLRLTEPSEGGEGADPVLGINFFKGYSVSLDGTMLKISRHCYDREILAAVKWPVPAGRRQKLLIQVCGSRITVSDETHKELLTAADPHPLTHGAAGIWAEAAKLELIGLIQRHD